ncbi:MAG: FADH(2)-oxidizing methylenetetrahydrofolate--tRNA-(uracil(54)-C(5))-methyltransferase TrmFO [Clostridiales bacterium]|nr:FADH(2)-oxidizing methylenetetrahydrofolate--tRNA-(uracil(54)-C(5))-methyltransferase TrmFO [Clostridiales bacterium]
MKNVLVIGAGLAGVEAAFQIARAGIPVTLAEMKPQKYSPAHSSPDLAELVCSNSFKAKRLSSAAGMLKAEMNLFNSVCLEAASKCTVPAGGALAVDREAFARLVTKKVEQEPLISLKREEIKAIPKNGVCLVAAGPLASEALSESIAELCGQELNFFDAAAPIVAADSIDMDSAFYGSRYDRGGREDYINCPLNREEYDLFHQHLLEAKTARLHPFDSRKGFYEACLPIEVLAARGYDTLRFGPMRPVGLRDPKTGHRPWALLQLRREDNYGKLLNLVGFQTNLTFPEQKRVFGLIPALKNAEYFRYGVMHRNTFINSPNLLKQDYSFKDRPGLFFAGQITGVEGYMESAASGILAGINAARFVKGEDMLTLPTSSMMGALTAYISTLGLKDFQPMGANFGIIPALDEHIKDKKLRYQAMADRGIKSIENLL